MTNFSSQYALSKVVHLSHGKDVLNTQRGLLISWRDNFFHMSLAEGHIEQLLEPFIYLFWCLIFHILLANLRIFVSTDEPICIFVSLFLFL